MIEMIANLISLGVSVAIEEINRARAEGRELTREEIKAEVEKTLNWELGTLPLPEDVEDGQ